MEKNFQSQQHILGIVDFSVSLLIFLFVDQNLEKSDKASALKDIQVMKVIHDLKNPILSIKNNLIDIKINPEEVLKVTQHDCEDMEDMLENMRTQFKIKQGMELKEKISPIESQEFAKSLGCTHAQLVENGGNFMHIILNEGFPEKINIPRTMIKRIVNNFITNSLKHTVKGHVYIEFKMINELYDFGVSDDFSSTQWISKGLDPFEKSQTKFTSLFDVSSKKVISNIEDQFIIEIRDTGSGIPNEKIEKIFDEKESDESGLNQDGTGLGLPICVQLCEKIGSFIRYTSKSGDNSGSIFRLFVQRLDFDKDLDDLIESAINIDYDYLNVQKLTSTIIENHKCNQLLIAEDQVSIMRRYLKQLEKNKIPHKEFQNGLDLQKQVEKSGFLDCGLCSKLIVMTDLNMPYMGGRELAENLNALNTTKDIRVILVSAEDVSDQIFQLALEKPAPMNQVKEIQFEQYQNFEILTLSIQSASSNQVEKYEKVQKKIEKAKTLKKSLECDMLLQ